MKLNENENGKEWNEANVNNETNMNVNGMNLK